MADFVRVDQTSIAKMSEGAAEVLAHLCEGECQTYGSVLSWWETRGDCVHVVTCPSSSTTFHLDDDDISALERWTEEHGSNLVCGVKDVA